MRFFAFAIALLSLSVSMPGFAADAKTGKTQRSPDPVVGRHLDSLKYQYMVDDDGDYKLTFKLDDDRTQLAYVLSSTESFGEFKVREVWAPAYRADDDQFPAVVANRLLEDSHTSKLGGWVKQGNMAVFVVRVPAEATAAQLDDAIDFVLRAADQMEKDLTGKDEF